MWRSYQQSVLDLALRPACDFWEHPIDQQWLRTCQVWVRHEHLRIFAAGKIIHIQQWAGPKGAKICLAPTSVIQRNCEKKLITASAMHISGTYLTTAGLPAYNTVSVYKLTGFPYVTDVYLEWWNLLTCSSSYSSRRGEHLKYLYVKKEWQTYLFGKVQWNKVSVSISWRDKSNAYSAH